MDLPSASIILKSEPIELGSMNTPHSPINVIVNTQHSNQQTDIGGQYINTTHIDRTLSASIKSTPIHSKRQYNKKPLNQNINNILSTQHLYINNDRLIPQYIEHYIHNVMTQQQIFTKASMKSVLYHSSNSISSRLGNVHYTVYTKLSRTIEYFVYTLVNDAIKLACNDSAIQPGTNTLFDINIIKLQPQHILYSILNNIQYNILHQSIEQLRYTINDEPVHQLNVKRKKYNKQIDSSTISLLPSNSIHNHNNNTANTVKIEPNVKCEPSETIIVKNEYT